MLCFNIIEIYICFIGENIRLQDIGDGNVWFIRGICFIVLLRRWHLLHWWEWILLYNFFGENNPCFLSSLRFPQVVELLVQTGAHLTESPLRLGEVLVSAAAADNVERLKSYHIAGADLSCADPCGRTALHAVRGAPWPGGGRWGLAWVLRSWGGDSVSVCSLSFLWAG